MNSEEQFIQAKHNALASLQKAKKKKEVDPQILPLLELINNDQKLYSTSSCAGRITLMQLPRVGDKKNAEFLGKWHRTITFEDFNLAVTNYTKGLLWFLTQSPIFHVGVKDFDYANKFIKQAVQSGFKNTIFKSTDPKIIVEVCSTERIDAPIGKEGVLLCNETYIHYLITLANDLWNRSAKKLLRLHRNLENI